jgi:glycosyltransferase involved in cell wall biosynthesis
MGMLCDVTPRKRLYEAVMLLDGVRRDQHPTARLHIGGRWSGDWSSEEYYEALRRLIRRLDLADHVIFYGHVADTPRWFRQIDVFISHSYREGQQVALLEAMAAACCCFSHVWDGADEVLPHEYLYTTDAELLEKISAHLQLPEEQRRICGARMRAIAEERFAIETTTAKIRLIIDETMDQSCPKGVAL